MLAPELLDNFDPISDIIDSEASWYRLWDEIITPDLTPSLMALKGGLYASTLSWVFIAGYQAAVRCVYPEIPAGGWAAFAASEDGKDPVANPPLYLLERERRLSLQGTKSWVAQSRHVNCLIITARDSNSDSIVDVMVDCEREGVSLTHRDNPSFLSSMSQGFARFENTPIDEDEVLGSSRRKQFIKNEAKFVMLASAAWMFAQSNGIDSTLHTQLRDLVINLVRCCDNANLSVNELAVEDTKLQTLFKSFEQLSTASEASNWSSDKNLISLYSAGIQKRAASRAQQQE